MPRSRIYPGRLPNPIKGLSKELAEANQPPLTTSDAQNYRGIDPKGGRSRGGQRAGGARQTTSAVSGANPIKRIAQVVRDNKTISYTGPSATIGTSEEVWTADTPSTSRVYDAVTDQQGNILALDGDAGMVKLNSEGAELFRLSFPVQEDSHQVRAIAVDEFGAIYAGVSGDPRATVSDEDDNGVVLGNPKNARIWKYRQEPDDKAELEWELPNPDKEGSELGGFCQDLRLADGVLYALLNDNRRYKAYLVRYEAINSPVPREEWRKEVPYPASRIDVNGAGEIVGASEGFQFRGTDPANPDADQVLEGWTPEDLDDSHKLWSRYDLRDPGAVITDSDTGVPKEGANVLQLNDLSGNGRHFYATFQAQPGASPGTDEAPPTYVENALNGFPGIRFNGVDAVMRTLSSPSDDVAFRDGQKSAFPMYRDQEDSDRSSQFVCFMLVRPARVDSPAAGDDRSLITQALPAGTGWSHDLSVIVNSEPADDPGSSVSGATATGAIWCYNQDDGVTGGKDTDSQPLHANFVHDGFANGSATAAHYSNGRSTVLLTFIHDNGVDTGASNAKTRSLWRVNGIPFDRWESDATYSSLETELGTNDKGVGTSDFDEVFAEFDLLYMAVYERKDPDSVTQPTIISHPVYPDAPASLSSGGLGKVLIATAGTGQTNGTHALSISGGGGSGAAGTVTIAGGVATATEVTATGSGYTSSPTITISQGGTPATFLARMFDNSSPTDLEKYEAYLAWGFGLNTLLAGTAQRYEQPATTATPVQTNTVIYPHPYASAPATNDQTTAITHFQNVTEIAWKVSGDGSKLVWAISGPGLGHGIKVATGDDTAVYTMGRSSPAQIPADPDSLGGASIRKLNDSGSSVTHSGGSAWADELTLNLDKKTYRIDSDADGNAYFPCDDSDPSPGTNSYGVKVLLKGTGTATTITEYNVGSTSANWPTHGVLVPRKLEDGRLVPAKPDYESDLTNEVSECIFVFGENALYSGTATEAVRKVRLVTSAPNTDPPRSTVNLAVSNGVLATFTTTPSTVATAFDTGARFVDSTNLFQKVYFTDGEVYKVYDPKAGTVADYKSASAGEIPPRGRLITTWRERIVIARFADDPQNFAMSAQGDAEDWDFFPPVVTPTQAVTGNNPIFEGKAGDIINAIIPVSDDLLIFGGDRAIFRVSGDIMAGGQIDRITSDTGIAFGRAHCRDDQGRIWFFGSRGGLWVMDPAGTQAQEVTDYTASRELQDAVDFSTHYVELAYDHRHEGVWIIQSPFGAGGTLKTHYFYDTKHGGLWPDAYNKAGIQPTCLGVLDGDAPADRRVVFGSEDGIIRKWDEDAKADDDADGTDLQVLSRVLLGPYQSPDQWREMRLVDVSVVLANEQSGALLNVYSSSLPDVKGDAKLTRKLKAGRNDNIPTSATGAYIWLELVQGETNQRFALEEASFRWAYSGRRQAVL